MENATKNTKKLLKDEQDMVSVSPHEILDENTFIPKMMLLGLMSRADQAAGVIAKMMDAGLADNGHNLSAIIADLPPEEQEIVSQYLTNSPVFFRDTLSRTLAYQIILGIIPLGKMIEDAAKQLSGGDVDKLMQRIAEGKMELSSMTVKGDKKDEKDCDCPACTGKTTTGVKSDAVN